MASNNNNMLSRYTLVIVALAFFAASFITEKIYFSKPAIIGDIAQAEQYLKRESKRFDHFLSDSTLLRKLALHTNTLRDIEETAYTNLSVFLYKEASYEPNLLYWSTQKILPPQEVLDEEYGEYFYKLTNGEYYVIKKPVPSLPGVTAYGMVLVRSSFFIQTDYLPHEFAFNTTAENRIAIADKATDYPVKTEAGKTLFYLDKKAADNILKNNWITILLRVCGLFLLLLAMQANADRLSKTRSVWAGIGVVAVTLIGLRAICYLYPDFFNLRQYELFDPAIYGSNVIQRSLGDLLINTTIFSWIIIYSWFKLQHRPIDFSGWKKRSIWAAGVACLALLIASTFFIAATIRSIVADSKISFDVTDFFSLTIYTGFGFLVLANLSLSYYYFTQLLFRSMIVVFKGRTFLIYLAIGFSGLIYLTFNTSNKDVLFYLPVLLWLIGYTWLVSRDGLILYRLRFNIAGILFWIFVFCTSISVIMLHENKNAEWARRKFYIQKIAEQYDPSSENLMSIAIAYLDNDFLSHNFHRFSDSLDNRQIRDSIINSSYSGYRDKFTTNLFVYDSLNNPVNNTESSTYNDLSTIIKVQSRPTGINDLFYYETSFDKYAYITERVIRDSAGSRIGSFFFVSIPKKYSSDALFPELFRQFKKNDPESSPIYSYAVYNAGRLMTSTGKYPFPTWLSQGQVPKDQFVTRPNGDYDELWYRASNEKVAVMVRKRDTLIESISLFSYLFCAFLLLVAIVKLLSILFKYGYKVRELRSVFYVSIRNQVHNTFIFVSLFSFVVIGVATISFFINRYEKNNSDKLSRTMNIMLNQMQQEMGIGANLLTGEDVDEKDSLATNQGRVEKILEEVSDIHGVDVNIYDLSGDLKVSSQKEVYTQGVLSNKIDPVAFYNLSKLRYVQHVQKEKIGRLSYLSVYAPVRDQNGLVYAYLGIPYFTSEQELKQEISNFLITIIILNAFIFLIAGVIALIITNRITRSFTLISLKMREVNLSKNNEKIDWPRNDEIGQLVSEYNTMVGKLDESATALAKSEREGAWREMARQVAHEIKNPLTPMKLSLQYLQKAINSNHPDVARLSQNVANTLVEQIDHLSKIASDFSQFANIGNVKVEVFDLHDKIRKQIDLHSSNSAITIHWKPVPQPVYIAADRTQMNRLFTNLIINAIDALGQQEDATITISENLSATTILISIADNGTGIPKEFQANIFTPNFTTKTSGTGLGLAMCKSIVEQAHGHIWFTTAENIGTTFFIQLPLVTTEED